MFMQGLDIIGRGWGRTAAAGEGEGSYCREQNLGVIFILTVMYMDLERSGFCLEEHGRQNNGTHR